MKVGSEQISPYSKLKNEDRGDAKLEFLVQRFVMPNSHSAPCSDASADDSHGQQGGFRYAPFPSLCLVFVQTKEQEGHHVDGKEINEKKWKHILLRAVLSITG